MQGEQNQLTRWFIAAFLCCVIVTGICIAFVDRAVSSWSHATLHAAAPFVWLTHMIDPFVAAASIGIAGLAIAGVFGWRPGPFGRALIAVCVAVLIATVLKEELKYLFGRTWPETWVNNNPSWIKDGVYRFEPLHGGRGWASFPSGHMTIITAPCAVLWCLAPRIWRWLWAGLVFAMAIGLLGADYHFLGDIVAGTFVGAACGYGAAALTRGLVTVREGPQGDQG